MDDMTFVEKLEALRKVRGLSQSGIAAAAGISQPRISEWKREDSRGPTLPVALSIARALGVSLDYLADDAQDDPPAALSAAELQAVAQVRALGLSVDEVIRRLANAPSTAPAEARVTDLETYGQQLERQARERKRQSAG